MNFGLATGCGCLPARASAGRTDRTRRVECGRWEISMDDATAELLQS